MKGSLHTDELLGAVVARETGLRTGRRLSHVFIMDVPTYHKVLIVTDAAINIAPTLEDKVDICQNAIDLAVALGVATAEGRDPRRGGDRQLRRCRPPSMPPPCARWPSADRSRAACSTVRWRSTTPSAARPRRRRASIGGRRRSRHPARAGSRGGQHPGQATQFPGQRRQRRPRARRARADHPDEPRRQRPIADRQLRASRCSRPTRGAGAPTAM